MLTGRWVTNLTQLLAGNCGLRSPPSWKPKPQREGRGGEERRGWGGEWRAEESRRTSMEPCSRVRVAKCQMLATSLFVLLLGSAMAATAALSYFGPHFTVIGPVSADRTTYEALHHWAFSAGIALAALLTLGAMLSAAATVRGAGGLMAAAFLSFALVFCALVQVAFWRAHSPTQINRSRWTQVRPSSHRKTRAGLPCGTPGARVASTTILGGKSPQLEHGNPCDQHPGDAGPAPGVPGPKEARGGGRLSAAQHLRVVRGSVRDVSFTSTAFPLPCVQMEDAVLDAYDRAYERALRSASGSGRQELVAIQDTDCLRGIQSFLRVHGNIVSTLIGLGLAFTVYAMLLSSFIWFTIRLGRYPVSQRARDHPPQEPRVYRCIREGSPSPRPSKADAPGGRLSPSRRSGQLLLLQDTHPPTHGSGKATVSTRM
ncbi:tetraspanin-32 isoform X2 [Bos javanicus]|uniref:tetraspanin-32 isoform X2 n=1 Tax=Bos javanicus TaxID=9906 RepID=UPI002AA8CC2E|nr:tetraspanin-32 isoform X2 [Bos javanicus]